ncbi:MAG: ribonuclease Z [Cyclobacteriaceae bacterium]|nr:ribonuclease Z [Cyclobacteriaceae bacterium]
MSFNITILGSSGAVPAYGRFPSSQLIEIQNKFFLVDCGEGTQMQLMLHNCPIHRVNHIFISHLHGDHYLGLMGLLFTMHLNHRESDLNLYSHYGLDEIIITQLKHSNSSLRFKIIFHHLNPGVHEIIHEDKSLTVESIPLKHKLDCTGFLFREKIKPRRINKESLPPELSLQQIAALKTGADVTDDSGNIIYKNTDLTYVPRKSRSYAYCSDTAFNPDMVTIIRQVDMLYHEATFMEREKDKAIETLHSTAAEAATIAKQAGIGKLLIGHFSARYKELGPLLEEARAVFDNTHLACEGNTFTLDE